METAHTPTPTTPAVTTAAGAPQTVCGLTIRAMVHYDLVVLRKLNSPVIEQLSRATAGDNTPTPFTEEQGYEMVLLFTVLPREAAEFIAKGPEAFRQEALERIGFQVGPLQLYELVAAIAREFERGFSTPAPQG